LNASHKIQIHENGIGFYKTKGISERTSNKVVTDEIRTLKRESSASH